MFKFYYAIKEDFKLNYLVDWGFRYNENDFCWEYDYCDFTIYVDCNTKFISFGVGDWGFDKENSYKIIQLLFEMFKAGIVEEIGIIGEENK